MEEGPTHREEAEWGVVVLIIERRLSIIACLEIWLS